MLKNFMLGWNKTDEAFLCIFTSMSICEFMRKNAQQLSLSSIKISSCCTLNTQFHNLSANLAPASSMLPADARLVADPFKVYLSINCFEISHLKNSELSLKLKHFYFIASPSSLVVQCHVFDT